MKLLVFDKNIEGGTGTFASSLLKLKKYFPGQKLVVKVIVLVKPKYLLVKWKDFSFLRKKNYLPDKYSLSFENIVKFLSEILWFVRKRREFAPDVIISVDVHCNLIAQITGIFYKRTPLVLTTHIDLNSTVREKSIPLLYFFLKKAIQFFYSRAQVIVCVSKGVAKSLAEDFNLDRKLLYIIHYGINRRLKILKISSREKRIILTVARLDRQKDHKTLIKAFSLVNNELPGSRLWIAGEGPLKRELVRSVSDLDLTSKVKFLDWVNPRTFLRRADIFVLSSKREGFPWSLLEAISEGKPVVSTDTPFGPSEILSKGQYGILTPMSDENALKEAILTLLTNREKHTLFARKAFDRSLTFSEDKMLLRYKKLIQEVVKSKTKVL